MGIPEPSVYEDFVAENEDFVNMSDTINITDD